MELRRTEINRREIKSSEGEYITLLFSSEKMTVWELIVFV